MMPDLLGQRRAGPARAPRRPTGRPRAARTARRPRGRPAAGRRPRCRSPVLPASTTLLQVVRDVEPVGERLVHRLGDVQRDRRADQREQHERRSSAGRAARARVSATSNGGALVDRPGDLAEEAGEQPVDDERRGVLDQHRRTSSASCRPRTRWPARRRRSASPRTISSSGSTATGLKKWKPTTRSGCSSSAAISVIDSEEVLVARMQCRQTTASTSANTCCLTPISSKTASMTKSASANASLVSEPVTSALSRLALSGLTRPLLEQLVDLAVDVADALVDARLVEVGEHDRHLEPLGEQQRRAGWPSARRRRRRPWSTGRASALVGHAGRPLGPLLDQVERVEPGAQLVAHRSGRRAPRPRRRTPRRRSAVLASAIRSSARYGGGRGAVRSCRRRWLAAAGDARRPTPGRGRPRAGVDRRSRRRARCAAQASDCSRKSAGSNIASAMPSSKACGPLSMRFWLSGFSTMTVTALVGADQVGQQLGAAPARHQAEEALGQRERRHARGRSCGSGSAGRPRAPPPIAAPLTSAKVGTGRVGEPAEHRVAELGRCASACVAGAAPAGRR